MIHLDGADLVIEATGLSAGPYVQKVTWNGAPLERQWISHGKIARGGTLSFTLGAKSSSWGETTEDPL